MSWRNPDEERARRERLKLWGAGIGGSILLLGLWVWIARQGELGVSSRPFDMSPHGPGVGSLYRREKRDGTGLGFVRRSFDGGPTSVRPESLPGPTTGELEAGAQAAEPGPPPAGTGGASEGGPLPGGSGKDTKELALKEPTKEELSGLAAGGVGADKGRLTEIGDKPGFLAKVAAQVVSRHPRAMNLLLNNKWAMDAFFNNKENKEACQDANKLKGYLVQNANNNYAIAAAAISNPAVLNAGMETYFWKKASECPGWKKVITDPQMTHEVIAAAPPYQQLLLNPGFADAMSKASASMSGGSSSSQPAPPAGR